MSALAQRLGEAMTGNPSKYAPLQRCLIEHSPPIELSFEPIDRLVGGLPPTARANAAWCPTTRRDTFRRGHGWMPAAASPTSTWRHSALLSPDPRA
jgi:hypothetical protein